MKDILFYFAVKKIIEGKSVRMSMAQLTRGMIDLPKAKRNLPGMKYLLIELRYLKMKKYRKKQKVDFYQLHSLCYELINYFCDVCSYELISTEGPTAELLWRVRQG